VARSVLFALDPEMNLQPLRKSATVKMTFLHWEKATAAGGDFFVFELGGSGFCSLVFCLAEHDQKNSGIPC